MGVWCGKVKEIKFCLEYACFQFFLNAVLFVSTLRAPYLTNLFFPDSVFDWVDEHPKSNGLAEEEAQSGNIETLNNKPETLNT